MEMDKAVFSIISKTERDMAQSSYSLKTTFTPIAKNARIYLRFMIIWMFCLYRLVLFAILFVLLPHFMRA